MSTTYRKDRAVVFGIWRAPPSLLKRGLRGQDDHTCAVWTLLALPVAQKNYLKFEIILLKILQTKHVNEHLQVLGLPEAPPSVWLVAERECATTSIFMLPRRPMPIDTLKVNVSVRDGPTVLELNNDGGWQRTTREMKAKSKSIECERWYRFYSRKGEGGKERYQMLHMPKSTNITKYGSSGEQGSSPFCGNFRRRHVFKNRRDANQDLCGDHTVAHGFLVHNVDHMAEIVAFLARSVGSDHKLQLSHPKIKDYAVDATRGLSVHVGSSIFCPEVVMKVTKK
ncbi:hypothetical protein B0H14DRAFT_2636282 [Mycena olivaceomarginata]|nr:hypothetical protein B0H14DRAFT_2636282 [Mycena olivaceomarginata]